MKNIYTVLFIVVFVLVGLYVNELSIDEMGEWPEPVKKNNYSYCRLETAQWCEEGDWIGFQDSDMPKFSRGSLPSSIVDIRYVYCRRLGDPVSPSRYRMVSIDGGDIIYFCRLDSRDNIMKKADAAIEAVSEN